jgi:metal-dependent hydrolase (beta-lactamase superfamily II)
MYLVVNDEGVLSLRMAEGAVPITGIGDDGLAKLRRYCVSRCMEDATQLSIIGFTRFDFCETYSPDATKD